MPIIGRSLTVQKTAINSGFENPVEKSESKGGVLAGVKRKLNAISKWFDKHPNITRILKWSLTMLAIAGIITGVGAIFSIPCLIYIGASLGVGDLIGTFLAGRKYPSSSDPNSRVQENQPKVSHQDQRSLLTLENVEAHNKTFEKLNSSPKPIESYPCSGKRPEPQIVISDETAKNLGLEGNLIEGNSVDGKEVDPNFYSEKMILISQIFLEIKEYSDNENDKSIKKTAKETCNRLKLIDYLCDQMKQARKGDQSEKGYHSQLLEDVNRQVDAVNEALKKILEKYNNFLKEEKKSFWGFLKKSTAIDAKPIKERLGEGVSTIPL